MGNELKSKGNEPESGACKSSVCCGVIETKFSYIYGTLCYGYLCLIRT